LRTLKKKYDLATKSVHGVQRVKGLIAFTPEIDYDQTAIGLPPFTSVVFLIAK
jgi:hypothetical protein